MYNVNKKNHQIVEDAIAEVPKPAPVAKAILVERLLGRIPQERLPIDLFRVDALRPLASAIGVAVPGQMDLMNVAKLAGPDNVAAFLELRHASLLGTDLNDALVSVLCLDDSFAFRQVMRQWFF